jgi:hypothetical protein
VIRLAVDAIDHDRQRRLRRNLEVGQNISRGNAVRHSQTDGGLLAWLQVLAQLTVEGDPDFDQL